ncbi:MAG: geranylgeranylglycerol-phosphate geranylgeranyltransferase [Bacteroidota bacterium]
MPLLDKKFNFLVFSILLITASGYLINDYYDVEIDKTNKKDKVIIGKTISKNAAISTYFLLNIVALILIYSLNLKLAIFFLGSIIILWWYSYYLKKQPFLGNLIVSIYTAIPFLVIAYYFQTENNSLYLYCYFAFFISLIREIVKDIEDMEGDKIANCRTIPIILGIEKTKAIVQILFLAFVVSFFYLLFLKIHFPILITLIFLGLFIQFQLKLRLSVSIADFHFLSTFLKIIMFFGVISMIFV